jgi:predicted dehydrogenase
MRFALLGSHPDGLDLAAALVDSGRHQLVACTAPPEALGGRAAGIPRVSDLEEILADPAVEAVVVAGAPAVRPAQLRRALQSERHVLCVHPPDQTPEVAYEAAMIQRDTGRVLLPILPEALHPAVRRLRDFVEWPAGAGGENSSSRSPVGEFRLLTVDRASTGEVLDNGGEGLRPALPGWDVLRALGGEVVEVSAFAAGEGLAPGEPVLVAGRFEPGGVFQVTLLPGRPTAWWRLVVLGTAGQAELLFPQGWGGPAFLSWREGGELREESWEPWDPWPALVVVFEAALGQRPPSPAAPSEAVTAAPARQGVAPAPADSGMGLAPLSWQDSVRALELDDAARRSVQRRRANLLDYQEASEEVGFKGTMTLVGCALLWGVLLLLIVSRWVPQVGWLILPLLLGFIGLQLLRYLIPRQRGSDR